MINPNFVLIFLAFEAFRRAACYRSSTLATAGLSKPPWPGSCKSSDFAADTIKGINLSGKTVILTGADGNIASEVSLALAQNNASMILACRTLSKCEAVRRDILEKTSAITTPEIEQLDLSSRANIADFAKRILSKYTNIHVLINSAGTYLTSMTNDGLVCLMETNVIGPAFLTHLLLPALRGGSGRDPGRVVNVAAVAQFHLPRDTTVANLSSLSTAFDPTYGNYYSLSKFLMVHHAVELAQREPNVVAFSLAPGVAIPQANHIPTWMKNLVLRAPYPRWLSDLLPAGLQHFARACSTNEAGLASCPQSLAQAASVTVAAAAWPGIEGYSGSYLDFDTSALPLGAPNVYGAWRQQDPTCVPREPAPMEASLRSEWYDEMLRFMEVMIVPGV